jgi:hypothetical protein
MRRRSALPFALILAAALPGCSNTPTTPSGITRSVITVVVTPTPVPVTTSTTSIGLHTVKYKVVVTETAGLGGEFVQINSTIFDETTGAAMGFTNYDAADLVVFVGSKRLEGSKSVEIQQQIDFVLPKDFKGGRIAVAVQFRDDRANLQTQSLLVVATPPAAP